MDFIYPELQNFKSIDIHNKLDFERLQVVLPKLTLRIRNLDITIADARLYTLK